jgi:hypothetical protein
MGSEFITVQCNFPDLAANEQVSGSELSNAKVEALLENTIEIVRKKLYDYAPIDKAGIAKFAQPSAAKITNLEAFISALSQIKPGAIEAQMVQFCRDDRNPQKIIEKKLAPVTDIAVNYYLSILFEKMFPVKVKSSGKPQKKEFRFVSNLNGWLAVRKVNLEVAENKEVLSCMVHTLGTIDNKIANYHPNAVFFGSLKTLVSKYPVRKSFGKLVPLIEEAKRIGLLPENDPFLRKYALLRIMGQVGYSPYLTGEMLEAIYPELKIPKPRGRIKKD